MTHGRFGRRFALSALAFCTLWVGACAGLPSWSDLDQEAVFEDAQKRYTLLMRWAEFERASRYVDPDHRADFLEEAEKLRELRFTDYVLRSRELHADQESATARVFYRAYHVSSLIETTYEETQEWRRDEESGAWRVQPTLQPRVRAGSDSRS